MLNIFTRIFGSRNQRLLRQYGERARQQRANPAYGETYWKAALRQIEGKGTDWRQ